jgi:hypothetical protein
MPANFGIDGCGYSGDFPECLSPPGKLRRDCHPRQRAIARFDDLLLIDECTNDAGIKNI